MVGSLPSFHKFFRIPDFISGKNDNIQEIKIRNQVGGGAENVAKNREAQLEKSRNWKQLQDKYKWESSSSKVLGTFSWCFDYLFL